MHSRHCLLLLAKFIVFQGTKFNCYIKLIMKNVCILLKFRQGTPLDYPNFVLQSFFVCRFLSLVLRLLAREVLMGQCWAKLNLLRKFVRVTRPVMMEISTQLLFCTMKLWLLTHRTASYTAIDQQHIWKSSSMTRHWMMQSKLDFSIPNGLR